jgi:hypothetical protein
VIVHSEPIEVAVEREDAYVAPTLFDYGTIQEWTAGRMTNGLVLSLNL